MQQQRSDRLLRAAIAFFVVGLVSIAIMFIVPAVTGGDERAPIVVSLLTNCAPIGFVLGLIYALRSGRRQR
ncbi:hypothetical protein [Williamsia sp. CHRR-6]|uniref:hypothetical protein n=1 Tax=Williamsia sp. CHRR-6 TaxID=2835871 RepID=UPI001BDA79FA|nr:hypothetical protein [Williamsia sp. CHRR-6]MBT0566396.1 hypothetical protein [Williamsia sp. CHRR-6]